MTDADLGFAWSPVEAGATLFLVIDHGESYGAAEGSLVLRGAPTGPRRDNGERVTLASWTLPTYERLRP